MRRLLGLCLLVCAAAPDAMPGPARFDPAPLAAVSAAMQSGIVAAFGTGRGDWLAPG
jgi:hypothetical protein